MASLAGVDFSKKTRSRRKDEWQIPLLPHPPPSHSLSDSPSLPLSLSPLLDFAPSQSLPSLNVLSLFQSLCGSRFLPMSPHVPPHSILRKPLPPPPPPRGLTLFILALLLSPTVPPTPSRTR